MTPWLLAGAGLLVTWALLRGLTDDPVCVRLGCAAYLTCIAIATLLYAASAYHWPMFISQQSGEGFWAFAEDAQYLHRLAQVLVREWASGAFVPGGGVMNRWYLVWVAALYRVLSVHPLHAAFVNAWCLSGAVAGALLLLRACGASRPATRCGVALVGFWPSLLLWSSQILKDAPVLALILLGLAGLARALDPAAWARPAAFLAGGFGLAAVAAVLGLLREFTGVAFVATALIMLLAGAAQALRRRAPGRSGRLLALAILVPVALLVARWMDRATAIPPGPPTVRGPHLERWDVKRAPDPRPTPRTIEYLRKGFVESGGATVIDPDVRISTAWEAAAYLPRGLATAFLAPFPWEWSTPGARTGLFRVIASVEMAWLYALIGLAIGRLRRLRRHRSMPMAMVALFCLLMAVPMALTVANLGTLFRLRLQFLVPLLVLLALTEPFTRRAGHSVVEGC